MPTRLLFKVNSYDLSRSNMSKKILFAVGGFIGLLFLVANVVLFDSIASQEPKEQKVEEQTQQSPIVERTPEEIVAVPNTRVQGFAPPPASALQSTPSQYQYYSVAAIVDGDTIKVRMNGNIETLRLIGIDTPETVDPRTPVQCFGKEASNKAKELLSGKRVRLELDVTQGERDKYGRLLAYIYREDGLFYNKYMIEEGYAHEYTYHIPYTYQTEFKAAQTSARTAQRGFWSPYTCNGDTASSASTATKTAPSTTQLAGKFYTSSHDSAKYYYPEQCSGWKSLSTTYLQSFDTLEALLATYPSRTKSPQCE